VAACQYKVRPGPGKLLKWGVWETPAYDGLVARGHDDLLVSASLTAILDGLEWTTTGESALIQRRDALEEIDGGAW